MGAVKMCGDGFLHKRQLPQVLALQSGFGDVIGNVAGQGDAAAILQARQQKFKKWHVQPTLRRIFRLGIGVENKNLRQLLRLKPMHTPSNRIGMDGLQVAQSLRLVLLEKGLEFFRGALNSEQQCIGILGSKLQSMFAFARAYLQTIGIRAGEGEATRGVDVFGLEQTDVRMGIHGAYCKENAHIWALFCASNGRCCSIVFGQRRDFGLVFVGGDGIVHQAFHKIAAVLAVDLLQLLMAQLRLVIVFLLVVAVGNGFDFGQLFGGQFVRHGEPRLYVGKMKQTLCVVVCLKNAACKV